MELKPTTLRSIDRDSRHLKTVQRKGKHMQGDIMINGKKMTMTEFVELFFETEDKVKERDLQIKKLQKELDELETELRVKEDLFKIKNAISNEPTEENSSRPSIDWYECEMMKGLEEISRQKAIINNLVETIYLLQTE